jgi:hypothetical protein
MPRPGLPPTPASSTDILAKENEMHSAENGFTLPPPAIHSGESSVSSNVSVKSDSSYRPTSPTSSRKRPRTSEAFKQNTSEPTAIEFSLPPPPTRSRRIIQMKPGANDKKVGMTSQERADKKKPSGHLRANSNTTAAGKKTARKTAHSIIERRRRSKMNEEFETLKGMIPACRGQSMHKLAILQAGIDYMRYLEQCVTDLKSANRAALPPIAIPSQSQISTPRPQSPDMSEAEDDEDSSDDMDGIEETQPVSPAVESLRSRGYASTLTSPAIQPQEHRPYTFSKSANNSTLPSPSFGPLNSSWSSLDRPRLPYLHSADTSPAILPDQSQDADQEASAALLMLNHDRRYSRSNSRSERPLGGGLSVKDLLSS